MNPLIDSPAFFIGKGDDTLLSFGSGQPDLPPPEEAFRILPTYKDFKYGLVQGQENLREALSTAYEHTTRDHFIITNGASEALDLICRYLRTKGDHILLPRPYYYSYPHNARFSGLKAKYYDLEAGKINLENFVEQAKGCIAVIINSPSNPTGSIQEIEVLKTIEQFANQSGMYIISDEVYKDLIYERENYHFKGDHIITINSFSKTFAMCGFRVGYMFSTDLELIASCIAMKTHTSMNTNILGQEMAFHALQVPDDYIDEQVAIWRERRDTIYNGMKNLGLNLWQPEGAFYVFPEFNNSARVVSDLYYEHHMITYDGAWFGAPDRIRFSYALDKEKIEEGLLRLETYLQSGYDS